MSCECQSCKRAIEFQLRLEALPEPERSYWKDVFITLENVEMDRDWANAVIEGSWPNADEVIERARSRFEPTDAGRAALRGEG